MKYILHVIATLRIGGAETVAKDLGLCGDLEEFETHYIVFGEEIGEYEKELVSHGCKIFRWPSPSSNYFLFNRSLRKLMRQYPYQAVHAHTMFNIGWVMLAAKQSGIPVRIAHSHSALINGNSAKKRVYELVMRKLILSCATDLVACGKAAGNRLYGKKAFQNRGKLILNGIHTEAFAFNESARQEMRRKLNLTDAFLIGNTGHLIDIKNQSFLIRLMPEILKRKPNARLILMGEGEDRPILEQLIHELKLEEKIIMTGNVRNVPDFLCAMDVFALPSLYEGMPLSVLEAQANGLPIVLSENVPDDVKQTNLIQTIPLSESEHWVGAICSAKRENSDLYAYMLETGGFDTQSMVEKFYRLYRNEKHC